MNAQAAMMNGHRIGNDYPRKRAAEEMTGRAAHDRYQARFFAAFRKFSGRRMSAVENRRSRTARGIATNLY
jgi:hypothetical protein